MTRNFDSQMMFKRFMSSILALVMVYAQVLLPVVAAEPAHTKRRTAHSPKKKPRNPIGAVSAEQRAAMATARKHQFVLSAVPTDLELLRSRPFSEPMVPMGVASVAGENSELAKALIAFKAQDDPEDVSVLKAFLDANPNSRWCAALALNVGLLRRETGYLSEALTLFDLAWSKSKDDKGKLQSQIAQRAMSELVFLQASLGLLPEMKASLAEIGKHAMLGSANSNVDAARAAAHMMEADPTGAFRCGPQAVCILMSMASGQPVPADSFIRKVRSTSSGTNLLFVKQLADRAGLKMQIAKRSPGAEVLTPSVMHFDTDHFSALTRKVDNKFLVEDPTFDRHGNILMSSRAIDSESDGYFLVAAGNLPAGWRSVSDKEAAAVFGKGGVNARNESKSPYDPGQCMGPNCGDCSGMAVADAFAMQAELHIMDVPLSYNVPIGPDMSFSCNYNQNEIEQLLTCSNLGANWSTNWVSSVSIDGSDNAIVHLRGGGIEEHLYSGNSGNPYGIDVMSQADLTVPSAGVYNRLLRDGSIEVFDLDDGSGNFFMTEVIDARGNSATIQYDGDFRIESVTDANGNVTTFDHVSNNPLNSGFLMISAIHDPFGRSCTFSYDVTNTFLESITDSMGIVSSFNYDTGTGFIESMTTPYGTTEFETYSISGLTYPGRGLKFSFPDGTSSVIENTLKATLEPDAETYFWSREALARYPDDPDDRIFSHCQRTRFFNEGISENESRIVDYNKMPLESRVVSTYPSCSWPNFFAPTNRPSSITQRNDTSIRTRFSITGTITPGDTLYIKVQSNVLPGGQEIVSYVVQSGDTAASILEEFVDLLNNNVELNKRGYYAEIDNGYLVTVPQDLFFTYSQAYTSGGATETFNFELEGDWSRSPVMFTIGGTPVSGDTVSFHSPLAPTYPTFTYTVQTGDTAEVIAKNLAYQMTNNSVFISKNWAASALGKKIWLHPGWGGGNFWVSTTGTVTASSAGVTDQSKSEFEWNSLGYPTKIIDPVGRELSYEYAGNNIDLEEIHETRDSNDFVLGVWTYNSQHLPLTHIDGSGQETVFTYNVFGQPTSITDALSNVTTYEYTSTSTATVGGSISVGNQASIIVNDPDLPGGTETVTHTTTLGQTASDVASALASAINGNTDLQTLGVTASANGAVVTLKSVSVNATTYGQSVTGGVTVALSAVAYGFLTKVTGPLQENDVTTFVWNENGTLASSTDAEGYMLAFEYDDMDRLVKTTFPDGTTEQTVFQDLDAIFFIDRLGRTTQRSFDSMQQLALEIDPLGRKTEYTWCSCGSLSTLTDAAGNTTTRNHDLQGRVIEKVMDDGTKTKFIWDPNRSVVEVKRDALGQNTQYYRNWDGTLNSIQYVNAVNATSPVLNTYDLHYNRLVQARNGWGFYNYEYNDYITDPTDPPITGGGRLDTITNSVIPNSDITFEYDELGRTTNRSIDGANNSIDWVYDEMSRVVSETNEMGQFDFNYVDNGSGTSKGLTRLASIDYPNGQIAQFDYYPNAQDKRLREIKNLDDDSQVLSQFNYAHDASGQITRWLQQQKSRHLGFGLDYDAAGQLTGAVSGKGQLPAPFADQHFFSYDAAANRKSVQTSQVQNLVIGGSKTTSDVITVTVTDSGLSGGTEAVAYTVLAGDANLSDVATNLAATITANSDCQSVGIDAVSFGTTVTLRSKSPNVTTYSVSLSGGATETASLGINAAVHNATIGGTPTTNDVVQITVRDPALSGGSTSVSRTVQGGDTLTSIAAALTSSINGSGSLSGAGITATSNGPVIAIQSLSPNVTSFTKSVTGAGTETVTLGPSLNGTVKALIGGSKTTADSMTISVFDAGLPGGDEDVTYVVQSGDNLASITSGLASAINANSNLQGIGVTASSSGTLLTITSVSRNATRYLTSKSSGATETILFDLPPNGTTTASIAGSVSSGDQFTLTVYDAGLAGGSVAKTVTTQTTPNGVATALAAAVNGDSNLTNNGITATAAIPTSSVSVVNVTSTSTNATTYTFSRTGSSTIALSKNVGVSQATFNNVNELTAVSAGGNARFQGNTDRPALPVTVAGNAVDMPTSQSFSGNAALSSGSNSISVAATAGGGSGTTTNTHKLEVVGAGSQTLTYDDNGNLTNDGTNSYLWDCENRLIQITYPSSNNKTEFIYGPAGIMVKLVETVNGSISSTKQFIGGEERDGSGNVTKLFFARGQRNGSSNLFYALDHLGSIRSAANDSGIVQASLTFDPYGQVTRIEGATDIDFSFAGMYVHSRSGLHLAPFRAYNPHLGQWISKDPMSGAGYNYTDNDPVNGVDPSGLWTYTWLPNDPLISLKQFTNQFYRNNFPKGSDPKRLRCFYQQMQHQLGAAYLTGIWGWSFEAAVAAGIGFEGAEFAVNVLGSVSPPGTTHDRFVGSLKESVSFDTVSDFENDVAGARLGQQLGNNLPAIINRIANNAAVDCGLGLPPTNTGCGTGNRYVPFTTLNGGAIYPMTYLGQDYSGRSEGDSSNFNISSPNPHMSRQLRPPPQ